MNWRVLVVALLIPSVAMAEEPPLPVPQLMTYPPGDDKIVVVRKGETAPYNGQLFDDNTALRWATWLQQLKLRYGLDMKAEVERCSVRAQRDKEVAGIEAERTRKLEMDLRTRLKAEEAGRLKAEEELRSPPFYRAPGFWFGAGVVTVLATSAATVLIVNQAK